MKGAIAAFVAAVAEHLAQGRPQATNDGSISLLITGDEEGDAVNGTRKALDWLKQRGESLACCLVGQPTSDRRLRDMVKIGPRGTLNARLTARSTQGHTD